MANLTSIHVQPVKAGSEQHNKREKRLDYVREELSHLNDYWEADTQSRRLETIKSRYQRTTGQKMQAKSTPIREAVVVINEKTTMGDMKKLADAFRERFGIDVFQIAIHRDEGFMKSKTWKPNLHAHLVIDWTDTKTGKSIKLSRDDMAEMQTLTANVLQMERGRSSDKRHLSAIQFKVEAEKMRLEEISVSSARKKAAIEATNSLVEAVKLFLGVSPREKEIEALKQLKIEQGQEIASLQEKVAAADTSRREAVRQAEEAMQQAVNKAERQAFKNLQEAAAHRRRADFFASLWEGAAQAVQVIVDFVKSNRARMDEEEVRVVDTALGERPEQERVFLLGELMRRARALLKPVQKIRLDNMRDDLRKVATREYRPKQIGAKMDI